MGLEPKVSDTAAHRSVIHSRRQGFPVVSFPTRHKTKFHSKTPDLNPNSIPLIPVDCLSSGGLSQKSHGIFFISPARLPPVPQSISYPNPNLSRYSFLPQSLSILFIGSPSYGTNIQQRIITNSNHNIDFILTFKCN